MVKNYEESIIYMKSEMNKQSKSHRQPYIDAIEAMENCIKTEPILERARRLCDQIDILNTRMIKSKILSNRKGAMYDRDTRL